MSLILDATVLFLVSCDVNWVDVGSYLPDVARSIVNDNESQIL